VNEPIRTTIRDRKFRKVGMIKSYTSDGYPIVEWSNGGVDVFRADYDVLEIPEPTEQERRLEVLWEWYRRMEGDL
jgi:hypothetical protein